jgi:sec-independent protein translocase protein TatB
MFDIGFTELMVIGVVSLIVIGPKDLPDMFRTMGRFTAKARSMARDFQRAMESAADDAGMKDTVRDLKSMTSSRNLGLDAVKEAAAKFEKWDPMKPAPKPAVARAAVPDPAAPPPADAAASPAPATVAAATEPTAAPAPAALAKAGPATRALAEAQAIKREARKAKSATPEAADTQPAAPKKKHATKPKATET